jgi:Cys-rich protein (TIGR01571 family)
VSDDDSSCEDGYHKNGGQDNGCMWGKGTCCVRGDDDDDEAVNWHIIRIIYASFWAAMLAVFAALLLVAICVCAPKQAGFTYKITECGCGDVGGVFCMGMFCPCMLWARIARFGSDQMHDTDETLLCLGYICAAWCLGIGPCLGIVTRMATREKLGVAGTCCQDCMIHSFAHNCALCQEYQDVLLVQSGAREPAVRPLRPIHVQPPAQPAAGVPTQAALVQPQGWLKQQV